MKLKKIVYKNVNKDGTLKNDAGAIETKGGVTVLTGSCGMKGCHCSDGHFLTVSMPLKDGKVELIRVKFDDHEEMKQVLSLEQ